MRSYSTTSEPRSRSAARVAWAVPTRTRGVGFEPIDVGRGIALEVARQGHSKRVRAGKRRHHKGALLPRAQLATLAASSSSLVRSIPSRPPGRSCRPGPSPGQPCVSAAPRAASPGYDASTSCSGAFIKSHRPPVVLRRPASPGGTSAGAGAGPGRSRTGSSRRLASRPRC